MPLDVMPPRASRFGSPLALSRVHWVRPELVAEVKFLTWTEGNLLRQIVNEGLREDKPATEVRRDAPHANPLKGHARPAKTAPVRLTGVAALLISWPDAQLRAQAHRAPWGLRSMFRLLNFPPDTGWDFPK
jgi:bifunctional non-homologous end joining protein LigD